MSEPRIIKPDTTDPETARIFATADNQSVRVEIAGAVYRIEREDHPVSPHVEAGPRNTGDDDVPPAQDTGDCRRIIREAKPKAKSLEWGPETRYGREDDYNTGYNDALDEYEDVLLKRIDADE